MSRLTVSQRLHEHRALSPDMAMRLEKLIGASAESGLRMQEAVEPWRVLQLLKQPPAADFQTIDAGSTLD